MLDRIVVKKVIGIKQCTKLLKSGEGKAQGRVVCSRLEARMRVPCRD